MSAAGKPDLVIPLKLGNLDEVLAALRKLRDAGGEANKENKDGLEGVTAAAKSFGNELLSLVGMQSGLGMIGQAVDAIKSRMEEAAQYTKEQIKQFQDLQEAMRIVATFKGETPSDQFTLEEAKAGAAAGLTPQQWKDFEKVFQGEAGQFIGQGKTVAPDQAQELERRAAAFMSARGIEASQGASIFGTILQQAQPGTSVDDLMKQFGQAYAVLEPARGDPGQLIGQMGQITAEGVDTLTASKIMRATAQRDPGEAGTYGRAMLRGLRELRLKGNAGELGIQEGMDVFQQVEAINQAQLASGQKQEDFLARYFKDERTLGGIQAGINYGVSGGLWKMAEGEAAGVTGQSDIAAVDKFKTDHLGARLYEQARKAAAEVETGQIFSAVEDARLKASRELTEDRDQFGRNRFQRWEGMDVLRATTGRAMGYGSTNDQIIQQRARADLEAQLTPGQVAQAKNEIPGMDGNIYLKRLVELAEQNQQKPLAAPAPQVGARP